MATRYWVGGTATWDATAGTKWASSSGGAGGASVPTAADDVIFDAASGAGTCTSSSSSVCRSLDFNGYTGGFTHASASITIGDGTAGLGNRALRMASGMTYTASSTSASLFVFVSTSGTQQSITTAGKSMGGMTWNGAGGSWAFADACTFYNAICPVTLTAGSVTTAGFAMNSGTWNISGSTTRSMNITNSTITVGSGSTPSWVATTTTNLTFTSTGSSIVMTGNGNASFAGGGLTYNDVSLVSGGGTLTITGNNNYATLTWKSSTSGRIGVTAGSTQTVSGLFTGSFSTTRVHSSVQSTVTGSTYTLSAGSVSLDTIVFSDCIATGAATWSGTNVGDGGGNTGITFSSPLTLYWVGTSGGGWSNATVWGTSSGGAGGSRTPLPQDTVVFDGNSITSGSRTITVTIAHLPSVDFTGVTNNPTIAFSNTNGQIACYGNLIIPSACTITSTNATLKMRGRGSFVIDTKGKQYDSQIQIDAPTANYSLASNFLGVTSSAGCIDLNLGSFNSGSYNFTGTAFTSNNTNTRSLNMGSGQWTLTGSGISIWQVNTSGLTFTKGTLPVVCNYSGSTGTRTITSTSSNTANSQVPDFSITAGTDQISISTSRTGSLDFTGFAGTLNSNTRVVLGNITLGSGMTVASAATTTTWGGTSGTWYFRSNGVTFSAGLLIDGAGANFEIADDVSLGTASSSTLTITNGTFSLGTKKLTAFSYALGSGTKGLNFGSGTLSLNGTGTVLNTNTNSTGYTQTNGTGTVEVTDTSASSKTLTRFVGSSLPTVKITPGGTGAVIFSNDTNGSIAKLQCNGGPKTITFNAPATYAVGTMDVQGTAGNLVTIASNAAGTRFTLNLTGQTNTTYASIKDCNAAGGATWYAGRTSTDAGNNVNVTFTDYFTSSLTDTITPTDTLTRNGARELTDTLSMSDTILKQTTKTFAEEASTITEVFLKTSTRVLSDTVTVTDILQKTTERTATETMTITEQFSIRNTMAQLKKGVTVLGSKLQAIIIRAR